MKTSLIATVLALSLAIAAVVNAGSICKSCDVCKCKPNCSCPK